MAKLKREALAHYLETAWNKKVADANKAVFEILGDDIEDMSVEMNADTSQIKNILGQSFVFENRKNTLFHIIPLLCIPGFRHRRWPYSGPEPSNR